MPLFGSELIFGANTGCPGNSCHNGTSPTTSAEFTNQTSGISFTTQQTSTNETATQTTVQTANATIQGNITNASSTAFTGVTVNQTTSGSTATSQLFTTTPQQTDTKAPTTKDMDQRKKSSNTTVIVTASVGTFAAVIFVLLFFLIRRRHILKTCNLLHKKPGDIKKSTGFSNDVYPDFDDTSNDSGYADIPLDNFGSIKIEDNVYQTIDPLQEQETVIDDKYSHILNALPLTNSSYSHIAGDFQSKRVPDYTHIAKLKGTLNENLKLKTNESDTSYDVIGNTKFGMTENLKVMEPTYNHVHSETNQTGKISGDNYSHLHVLNKTMQNNETMMNCRFKNEHNEPGFRVKEGDVKPKSVEKTEERKPAADVMLPKTREFSLTENDEENVVDHQYFVLEKLDKTEEKELPSVVKLLAASKFSLTEICEENTVDHQYFVLEKGEK